MNLRLGLVLVAIVALGALAGPWVVAADPRTQDLALRLAGPTPGHPLGLDELGRDMLARLVAGARVSMLVGVSVVSVSALLGLIVGGIAGYAGGWVDTLLGRIIDVLMAFPGILLAIALVAAIGPSLRNVVIALATIGWVGYARLVRGQVLKAREFEYVQAARSLGASARASSCVTSCRRPSRPCSSRRHSAWPARSSPKRRSASSAWACSRRPRVGAQCSTPAAVTSSTLHT
jgi:peptide/nickel transport system permease protein